MSRTGEARQTVFAATPEIFATGSDGRFSFPLIHEGENWLETAGFDEVRFVFTMWHPSSSRVIDLDRTYVELQGQLDSEEERWVKLAEVEPIVPAYDAGGSFDGWIVLPMFGPRSAYRMVGGGLEARARLQIRASAYFVV